jgi:transcriptional regulator with XRE-family HTH domain
MKIEEIGFVIKSKRRLLKYSQNDLAELSGLSDRTIRSIEKGETGASIQSLITVLNVLGLQINIELNNSNYEASDGIV